MSKKKKDKISSPAVVEQQVNTATKHYMTQLDSDPKYSLDVDPEDKYNMSEEQKLFIMHYVQVKNVILAAELAGIDEQRAKSYFVAYNSQQEIRRINMAMYQRQFSNKILTIEEIGGYLSSLITDENVALADRLKTQDKLKVAQMILDLNDFRKTMLNDPNVVMTIDIESEIKDLSVGAIKKLISQNKAAPSKEKDEIIDQINSDNTFTMEEIAYLKTLSVSELLQLLDDTQK